MITHKIVTVQEKEVDKIICDKCKKEITDEMEIQEMHHIRFTGGYSSVFGDMADVSCDLCQHCLKELIGDFCLYEDPFLRGDLTYEEQCLSNCEEKA